MFVMGSYCLCGDKSRPSAELIIEALDRLVLVHVSVGTVITIYGSRQYAWPTPEWILKNVFAIELIRFKQQCKRKFFTVSKS